MISALMVAAALTPGQFFEEEVAKELRWHWPRTEDKQLMELRDKVRFYNDSTLPQAYQMLSNTGHGVHSPSFNIAGNLDPFGHANREYPWGGPAGFMNNRHEKVQNGRTWRFVYLPEPIQWWRQRLQVHRYPDSQDVHQAYRWEYPRGTVFGEMLFVRDVEDAEHLFQLRLREKQADGSWKNSVFNPFRDERDLEMFFGVKTLPTRTVNVTTPQAVPVLAGEKEVLVAPKAEARELRKMLFHKGRGLQITADDWSVVPRGYTGIPGKCQSCHQTAGAAAWDLDRPSRDWYGRVRGFDEIFSFHVFDPRCISYDGYTREPVLNRKLLDAGLLVPKK